MNRQTRRRMASINKHNGFYDSYVRHLPEVGPETLGERASATWPFSTMMKKDLTSGKSNVRETDMDEQREASTGQEAPREPR